jgi:hypothetical protein
LIQAKVPFDIIFDDNLKDLSKYRVLVLADQECLSDGQLALVRGFVNQGGGLVATEHASLYTEWRQRRRDFGLKDLLKVEAPPWRGANEPEELLKVPPVRSQVGRGRAVYVAGIKPSVEKPAAARMVSGYWKLPVNWKELVEAVRWAAAGRFSLEVNAPLSVVGELAEQREEGKLLLHLLNYDAARTPLVSNIEVNLEIPEGKRVRRLSLLSPDEENTLSPSFVTKNRRVSFTVPRLKTYTLAAIQLE